MAHSDVLIFLTNITWIFLLFLFCYFFFVTFFLPSFYKTVRIRSLVKRKNVIAAAIYIRELFGLELFSVDFLLMVKEIFAAKIAELRFIFSLKVSSVIGLAAPAALSTTDPVFFFGFKKYLVAARRSDGLVFFSRFLSTR